MKNNNNTISDDNESVNVAGTLTIVLTSILFLALGLIMVLVDTMKLVYFVYAAGGILVLSGIWFIARYFHHKEYKKITNYGFSAGTLVVILGCCTLIRAQDIAGAVSTYLGILILIETVVMLQNAVQLKNLKGSTWIVSLIFGIIGIVLSLMIILDVQSIITKHPQVLYVALMVVGIFGLISFFMVVIRIKRYHKESQRIYERNVEESENIDLSKSDVTPEETKVSEELHDEELSEKRSGEVIKDEDINTEE